MRSKSKLSEREPVTIRVAERLFVVAGAIVVAVAYFFHTLSTSAANNLPGLIAPKSVAIAVILAVLNFRGWAYFIKISAQNRIIEGNEKGGRVNGIFRFLVGKFLLVGVLIWTICTGTRTEIISMIAGFIGFLLLGLFLTALFFILSSSSTYQTASKHLK